MRLLSFIWGIVTGAIFLLATLPCLGWINWINIPLAIPGLIISIVAMGKQDGKPDSYAIVGIVGCCAAIFFGAIRLFLGAGVF